MATSLTFQLDWVDETTVHFLHLDRQRVQVIRQRIQAIAQAQLHQAKRHLHRQHQHPSPRLSRLENPRLRDPNQGSRSMRLMLVILSHRLIGGSTLQGHWSIGLIVRAKLGRLLTSPRQHGLQRWFDGSSFHLHQGQQRYRHRGFLPSK